MSDLSLKELIIIHINYRDVFNAPISKNDLIKWIIKEPDLDKIQKIEIVLKELKDKDLIIEKKGFLAVVGKEEIINLQEEKTVLTQKLINKGSTFLRLLGKLPFIKFIGISGSVAAKNPTPNQNNHVDLDLFIIVSKNSLWPVFLVERIFTNILRFLKGDHFYCFNYVTDETFLEIHNKNFYTASEMVNLIPIIDKGVFNNFISSNKWFRMYYSKESMSLQKSLVTKFNFSFNLLLPVNYLFFFLYCTFKTLKKFDIKYIFDFKTQFNSKSRGNLKRISNPNGGYQEQIKMRFSNLLSFNFPEYISPQIIDQLFPPEGSFDFSEEKNTDDLEAHKQFKKYA